MGEVIQGSFTTTVDTSPDSVLDGAKASALRHVLVLGRWPDGSLYAAATTSDIGQALVMFEEFKKKFID